MRHVNLTPAKAASFVYRGIKNGLIEDARLEANSKTIYARLAPPQQHIKRSGLFVDVFLLHAIWVDSMGQGNSVREVMEQVSGTDKAEWSIKYLGAKW